MIYYANPSGGAVLDAMRAPGSNLGMIDTPAQGNALPYDVDWCADNGCFGKGYPGDDGYLAWLACRTDRVGRCAFATAPDVVGDAAATFERSMPMLPRIRALGFPVAFVAQNGLEHLTVPWDEFDALFIGGDNVFKLGGPARRITAEAKARGKWVHMGRVNSEARIRYAHRIGCDSADGTYLIKGPDVNLPKLLAWLDRLPHPGMRHVPRRGTRTATARHIPQDGLWGEVVR